MVLFYSAEKMQFTEQLWLAVAQAVPGAGAKRYRTLRGLTQALRRPGRYTTVAVLAAADREELGQFMAIRDLLWDLRLILVLPDDDPASVAAGHLLRPRFATCRDGSIEEITAVLGRLCERIQTGEKPETTGKSG